MKNFKTLLFTTALFIGTMAFAQAQSKVAHINAQELISLMPATKAAEAEIEKLGKTYEADIQSMITEYQNKAKQYEAEVDTKTDEENQKRGLELQTMQQNIQQYRGQAQQDMQKKELDLLKPITEKAKAAILKVARAQGFEYVLDSTQGGGVIMADGKNLLDDVKKELGF
ncbi:membrane protein [Mangrovimonas yunxiaonensis]|uniref:Membrane protein n=1 Tax=Mangrovimonas yunxiaonensis TaxID=1197477 RepID=A0A084TMB4_9FLAO|nr:OmpH family outer membrane protein [Mangrovimonas yunxiaonensis]KFB01850.1 membrane protein [Mangrovimonas yunxiaonensis]MBR9757398.1 OmpH family outer membrane protein [Algicola sp.]GGH41372.1 membrane protein [Mangrovimonas yunxiaonensis]